MWTAVLTITPPLRWRLAELFRHLGEREREDLVDLLDVEELAIRN